MSWAFYDRLLWARTHWAAAHTEGEVQVRQLALGGGVLLSECPPGRNRIGNHPGGGLMPQSGCPSGFAFQNMILSK